VPLLWVLPLGLYLASFILAFGSRAPLPRWTERALALGTFFILATVLAEANRPTWLILGGHLGVFFLGSLWVHRALADRRPAVSSLTAYYLWLALGGALGGAAGAILAPLVLPAPWEYPVLIGLTCAALPRRVDRTPRLPFWAVPIAAGVVTAAAILLGSRLSGVTANVVMFLPPAALAVQLLPRPRRFAAALVSIAVVGVAVMPGRHGKVIESHRNFYGTIRVVASPDGASRALVDGTTLHGRVNTGQVCTPLTYFHRTGPAGDVFRLRPPRGPVAVIGLGVGSLACYAGEEQWTFFELNPAVVEVARNERLFGPVAAAVRTKTVRTGDARVLLRNEPDAHFDLIVIDAFSSDAIPTHLLTVEAMALYHRKLREGGAILFNVSSRFADLPPVVAAAAQASDLSASGRVDANISRSLRAEGKSPSSWVLVTAHSTPGLRGWSQLEALPGQAWTDDLSSVLPVLRW
jgi:hypothetical protein